MYSCNYWHFTNPRDTVGLNNITDYAEDFVYSSETADGDP